MAGLLGLGGLEMIALLALPGMVLVFFVVSVRRDQNRRSPEDED
jgi:hypothetical protein